MKWGTRTNIKSDRLACIWLITGRIDPAAEFLFVPDEQIARLAADGIRTFDAEDAMFKHLLCPLGTKYGEQCTFQVLIKAFDLDSSDRALTAMGKILHAADIGHRLGLYEPKEGFGLWAIMQGLSKSIPTDHARIPVAMPLFDALYHYCVDGCDRG